jgi:hypothetical protein
MVDDNDNGRQMVTQWPWRYRTIRIHELCNNGKWQRDDHGATEQSASASFIAMADGDATSTMLQSELRL